MAMNARTVNDSPYKGSGQLTREQFLFYEMRTTARLLTEGFSENETIDRIVKENLFQYPTEKTIRTMARTCVARLRALDSEELIRGVAEADSVTARQICLYAMMKRYRLVWDFMLTVVGAKYRSLDTSFGKIDMNAFFMRLQEQDDYVASWSEGTVTKIKQVLARILVENEYMDSTAAEHLNPVLISPLLEDAIRASGQELALPAFNCLN